MRSSGFYNLLRRFSPNVTHCPLVETGTAHLGRLAHDSGSASGCYGTREQVADLRHARARVAGCAASTECGRSYNDGERVPPGCRHLPRRREPYRGGYRTWWTRPCLPSKGALRAFAGEGSFLVARLFDEQPKGVQTPSGPLPFDNADLFVIGDGPARTRYMEVAVQCGVSNCVHFLGWKERFKDDSLLRGAGLVASLRRLAETFGVAVAARSAGERCSGSRNGVLCRGYLRGWFGSSG